jgi:hypothetical protein
MNALKANRLKLHYYNKNFIKCITNNKIYINLNVCYDKSTEWVRITKFPGQQIYSLSLKQESIHWVTTQSQRISTYLQPSHKET